jgi:hypothetical protein
MQRAADVHHHIVDARLPQAAGSVDEATALDTAVDRLDAHTPTRDAPLRDLLGAGELPSTRLPGRPADLHLVERARQEAQRLEQAAPRRQGVRGGSGHPLIGRAAHGGLPAQEEREHAGDPPDVLSGVAWLLATLTASRLRRILGAHEASCGPIVAHRGERAVGTGVAMGSADGDGGPSGGTTRAAPWALATPRRWANAVTDRAGASPKARRGARRPTQRP